MPRCLLAWIVMLLVSVANGALRDFTYGKYLPDLLAHQLSTLNGIILLGAVIHRYVRLYPPASGQLALNIGMFWMSLTVAFEFLFFHYAGGHDWTELLANYDITAGRLWPLLLAWIAIAPYLFYRLRVAGS